MVENMNNPSKSPLPTSLLLIMLYYIVLFLASFILWLFFSSLSYFYLILVRFIILFSALAILWLIIVPFGIYLPDDQKSLQLYINDIHLGKESFKPFKLIILVSIGWIGLIIGISLILSYLTKGFQFNIAFLLKTPSPGDPAWFIFVLALIPAIWEEIAFRGVIFNMYEKKYQEETPIIIYNGVLFGLFHFGNLLFGSSLYYVILQVIYATLIGMYLAFMLMKTQKLYFCIITHYILDVLFFLFIYYV